jgi:hypothetical protein
MEGKKGKSGPAAPLLCIFSCMRTQRLEAQPANLPNTSVEILLSTSLAINVKFDIADFFQPIQSSSLPLKSPVSSPSSTISPYNLMIHPSHHPLIHFVSHLMLVTVNK